MNSHDLYQLAHEAAKEDSHVTANWLNQRASMLRAEEEKERKIHVWNIGPDGTEIFAAYSRREMMAYYRKLSADKNMAELDLEFYFEEIKDIDSKFEFKEDGETVSKSWREIAVEQSLPSQISTGYN